MAAKPAAGVGAPALENLSPELVLVDPSLAASARARLPERDDSRDLAWAGTSARTRPPQVYPASFRDYGPLYEVALTNGEALQRLLQGAVDSEVLGSLVPSRRLFRRRTTFVPTSAAAASVALFVVQLFLSQGRLG